jgi:hypothetical protein
MTILEYCSKVKEHLEIGRWLVESGSGYDTVVFLLQ